MFSITTYDYTDKDIDSWELPFDYHCIYIIENGRDAYIGESKSPVRRGKEHKINSKRNKYKKYHFNRMHVITGQLSEETPAKHYEKLLIKLMKVDQKFNVVNGDDGEMPHYYRKNEFELYFDELWVELEKRN